MQHSAENNKIERFLSKVHFIEHTISNLMFLCSRFSSLFSILYANNIISVLFIDPHKRSISTSNIQYLSRRNKLTRKLIVNLIHLVSLIHSILIMHMNTRQIVPPILRQTTFIQPSFCVYNPALRTANNIAPHIILI